LITFYPLTTWRYQAISKLQAPSGPNLPE